MQLLRDSRGWETWVTKATAYLSSHKLTHLLEPGAAPPARAPVPLPMEEQVQRRVRYVNDCVRARERGTEEPPIPTYQRLETEAEHAARLSKWQEENKALWSILIGATEGDAFSVANRAPMFDGVAAWQLLMDEYDNVTDTSLCLKYDNLFSMKMKGTDIEKHINLFREKIKGLESKNHTFPPGMEKTMFLRTLPSKYAQFKTKALTDRKLKPEDCYKDAKEWSEATLVAGSDEQNLRDVVAMLLSDKLRHLQHDRRKQHTRRPHHQTHNHRANNKRSSRDCHFGVNCKRRNCGYKHPTKHTHRQKKDNWQCRQCSRWNYASNSTCFSCGEQRTNKSRRHEVAHKMVHDMDYSPTPDTSPGSSPSHSRSSSPHPSYRRSPPESPANGHTREYEDARDKLQALMANIDKEKADEREQDQPHDALECLIMEEVDTTTTYPSTTPPPPETALQATTATSPAQVTFRVDSGASRHFGSTKLPGTERTPVDMTMRTATGERVNIKERITFNGVDEHSNCKLKFPVYTHENIPTNLFSLRSAIRNGYHAFFHADGSFLTHNTTKHIIPFKMHDHGWDIVLDADMQRTAQHAYECDLLHVHSTTPHCSASE